MAGLTRVDPHRRPLPDNHEQMVIVAVKDDPSPTDMGLHFFDQADWPQPGYTLIRQVATSLPAKELSRRR